MVTAWAYLRKSRAEEAEADVLWKHRAALLDLAERDGVVIRPDHLLAEVGSGGNIRSRPVFRALLDEWGRLPVDRRARRIVYVMEADRLSRGVLTERGTVQETIQAAGILIRTPGGWCDLADPDQLLLHEVKGSLARHELLRYKDRVETSRRTMTRTGKLLTGRPPMGYQWSKDHEQPFPDPKLFPILQEACRRVLTVSVHRLAREYGLCEETLLRALRNPTIAGWPARKWRREDDVTWRLPVEEWVWPEQAGDYPAACTLDEWHAIQRALAARYRLRGKTGTANNWCVEVVRFVGRDEPAICTSRWLGTGRPDFKPILTYAIRQHASYLYIPRDDVHERAEAKLRELWQRLPQEHYLPFVATTRATPARDEEALRRDLERLRQELANLRRQEARAEDEEDQLAEQTAQAAVKKEIEALKAELARRRQPVADVDEATRLSLEMMAAGKVPNPTDETALRLLARGLLRVEITITKQSEAGANKHRHRYERSIAVDYVPVVRAWL